MTYEIGPDGGLTEKEFAKIWKANSLLPQWGPFAAMRKATLAQHQADIERVKAAFLLLGGHINSEELDRCERAVLEALGGKETNAEAPEG